MSDDTRHKALYEEMIPDAERLGDHYLRLMLLNRLRKLSWDRTPPADNGNLILFPNVLDKTCDCMNAAPSIRMVVLQSAMIPFSIAFILFALVKLTLAIYTGPSG